MTHSVISIVGPTASGKTSLSLELAQQLDAEIVNLDAYQIYRRLDIGTAKPSKAELASVRHHLIDIVDMDFEASVADFQTWARAAIADITARGKVAVCVGGSGLYVRAVFEDMEFPSTDPEVRAKYEELLEEIGTDALHGLLISRAPDIAAQITPANSRRVVRALEVIELTGTFNPTLPDATPVIDAFRIGLEVKREVLSPRITARTHLMIDAGWPEEVRDLAAEGLFETRTASKALGYADIHALNRGEIAREVAAETIANSTLKFSKRQMQWFRRDALVHWYPHDTDNLASVVLKEFKA